MAHGVVEKVVAQALEQERVASHGRASDVEGDGPPSRLGVAGDLTRRGSGHLGQVDGVSQLDAPVAAGQHQQAVEEASGPVDGSEHLGAIARSSSTEASGSARATSTSVRTMASGVRSSWAALAAKRR